MHLPDGGSGDGGLGEVRERLAPLGAQVPLEHRLELVLRHGVCPLPHTLKGLLQLGGQQALVLDG